ncbi:gliding motility-associated C-terminal domain-containing protein [Gaetbulibacter sp. M240]|uniref:gliding motility-associated C-terminal domain-containing protein n=1 Tax=Gaetbulibacter sp. M240 TaxID=3126511 RepID=UPI00374F4EE4
MERIFNLIIFTMFFGATASKAQTSNIGLFTVNPDTQLSVIGNFDNQSSGAFINGGEAYFYGHLNNNGMADYIAKSGTVHLVGTSQQLVTGSEPFYLYNLIINNVSNLENAINMFGIFNVESNINFQEGIVNTIDHGGTLILENNGTVSNVSDFSFVDGFISKQGNDEFIFPIGDDELYRFAGISAPSGINSVFNARYVYEDLENPYPANNRIGNIIFIDDNEYWIFESLGGIETVDVTLSWDQVTTPFKIYSNPERIRIARWDFEEGAWTNAGGTVDIENQTVTSRQTIDGVAIFTIAGADLNIILPDDVVIWNAVSPNSDGKNDYLIIEDIELLPNNSLEIFNRWGAKVFSTSDYDSNGNVFKGFANDRADKLLPTGTYFYILKYDGSDQRVEKVGYLYLSTD